MPDRYTGVNGLDDTSGRVTPTAEDRGDDKELAAVAGVARALREVRDEVGGARCQMANGVRVLQRAAASVDGAVDQARRSTDETRNAAAFLMQACGELPRVCAKEMREEVRASLTEPAEVARDAWKRASQAEAEARESMEAAAARFDKAVSAAIKRIDDSIGDACGRVLVSSLVHYGVQVVTAVAALFAVWGIWSLMQRL